MKLLFLSQYYPPETGAGATRASTLRKYFVERGWTVDVLCELPNYPSSIIEEEFRGRWAHETTDKGGKVVRTWVIPTRRENILQQVAMFTSYMFSSLIYGMMHPGRYDAVYATSPPIFSALSGLLLARLYGVPFYFEVRDLWPDAAIATGQLEHKNLSYRISKRIERWMYRKADLVIPVTHRSETLIRKTCPEVRTFVAYNGVDTAVFNRTGAGEIPVSEPWQERTFRVGYVGTIGVIHDMDTVIRAAKLLEDDPDIGIVLVGEGSQSNQLRRIISELSPTNVYWLGNRPHDSIPAYLSQLDVGLNPVNDTPVFESILTVKFFEYLACGVPVINCARGIIREVGDASEAALTVEPGNPEALAAAIRRLKNDDALRKQLSENARPFVEKHFDRKMWAQRLADALEENLTPSALNRDPAGQDKSDPTNTMYKW